MINAQILIDSMNPTGNRLTTWLLTYPRIIHSEFMTHRVFSRNASSTRAIPVNRTLEIVKTNPAMPVHWGKNQSGMQADVELVGEELVEAKKLWLEGRDQAVEIVEKMVKLGLHKQVSGRLLEPWTHITVIATATEHENFFGLRAHTDAQPEFRDLAYLMLRLYQDSVPTRLKEGEWHIPFGDKIDFVRLATLLSETNGGWAPSPEQINGAKLKIATARCARVSYLNFDGKDDYATDIKLTDERLAPSGHWSAFEHCAEALGESTRCGNFVGWKQYRKFFPNENRSDGRVKRFGKV